jgi:hypothetical protein
MGNSMSEKRLIKFQEDGIITLVIVLGQNTLKRQKTDLYIEL